MIDREMRMLQRVVIGRANEIPDGSSKVFESAGRQVAVFNVNGEFHAIENSCPHRGAALSSGAVIGGAVACPLHGWEFNLATGECISHPGHHVARFEVHSNDGELSLEIPPAAEPETAIDDGIHRYLVRYGVPGWVAWFGSIENIECRHKDRVVVQTSRGTELGEVLSSPSDRQRQTAPAEKPTGEVLRLPTADDLQSAARHDGELPQLLSRGQELLAARHLEAAIVDVEPLLDGETVVLYFLGEQYPELESVAEELSQQFQLTVRFFPLVEPPPPTGGCGQPGCGGGGCGSGQH